MIPTLVEPGDFAQARASTGLSAAEVAEMFGCPEAEVVAMERGERPIDRRSALAMAGLVMICRAVEVPVAEQPPLTIR